MKVETLDTAVAETVEDVLADGQTNRLAVAKLEALAYTLAI